SVGIKTFDQYASTLIIHDTVEVFYVIHGYLVDECDDKVGSNPGFFPFPGCKILDLYTTVNHQSGELSIRHIFAGSSFHRMSDLILLESFFTMTVLQAGLYYFSLAMTQKRDCNLLTRSVARDPYLELG